MADFINLPCRDEEGRILVVVEAPRSSAVKLKYEPALDVFMFSRALPLGVTYPYDWGFVPSTRAEDGDPLDAMVLFDSGTWTGCVVPSKPIGVVRLVQRDGGKSKKERNDRVIVLPAEDPRYDDVTDLPKELRSELEQFFITVSMTTRKHVEVEGWEGPKAAVKTIDRAAAKYVRRGLSGDS
jgi:inorganic pyrophosphatase